jgi:chaperonin GroES
MLNDMETLIATLRQLRVSFTIGRHDEGTRIQIERSTYAEWEDRYVCSFDFNQYNRLIAVGSPDNMPTIGLQSKLERTAQMLQPLNDRVLVKPDVAPERTPGGILLPDTAKEKPVKGTVIATGPGLLDKNGVCQPLCVKVGDVVLYGKYSGNELERDGETLIMLHENEIFAKVV